MASTSDSQIPVRQGAASRLMLSVKRTLISSNSSKRRPPEYQVSVVLNQQSNTSVSFSLHRHLDCSRPRRSRLLHRLYICLGFRIQRLRVRQLSRLLWACICRGHLTCDPYRRHRMLFPSETQYHSQRALMITGRHLSSSHRPLHVLQ